MIRPEDSLAERLGPSPRVLYVTRDRGAMSAQLSRSGAPLVVVPELADDVSTDEITPAHACYYTDERIADHAYTGLRGGGVGVSAVRAYRPAIIVSGRSKGSGSSREVAPFAEMLCGARLVVARSFEKIYRQNCHNIGLLTTTDFGLLARLLEGERVTVEEVLGELDAVSREVVLSGGLLELAAAQRSGLARFPAIQTGRRAMTVVEKIIRSHAAGSEPIAVRPGDALFVRADLRFSHEYVTPIADELFRRAFGDSAELDDPSSVVLFRDHLTLLHRVMPVEHRRLGLLSEAQRLASLQEEFALRHGVRLFGEAERDGAPAGSEGICHNKIVEELALPGDVVVGTDSHTSTAGALGCLAFGVGSTDMAAAFRTGTVRIRVPESVRVVLRGELPRGVSAKDVMLGLLSTEECRRGDFIGKVLELDGEGVSSLSIDERATLANMAVEAGAHAGIVAVDALALDWLAARRTVGRDALARKVVVADPGAAYARKIELHLGRATPMVALPGDPRNGRPISEVLASGMRPRVDIAYGGSCTGSKRADIDAYAQILDGRRVADGVRFYVQFGSQAVRRYAEERGLAGALARAGAELLDPACGACIRAGPGVSERPDQVTVSAGSRNYPGRSGPGQVWLGSPYTVAAAAVEGFLVDPRAFLP